MMKTHWKITVLMTMIAFSTVESASAVPLFFDDNVSSNTLIANRESLVGSFDIQSRSDAFRNGTTDRHFKRGILRFSFRDDNDLTQNGFYHSRWERSVEDHVVLHENRRYELYGDAIEMVEINALGTTAYRTTDFFHRQERTGLPDITMTHANVGPVDYVYRTELYTSAIGWGGDIAYSIALNDHWLDRISTTGFLDYNLRALLGDMVFQSAVLELDYEDHSTSVPEPSTFLLLLLSVGLMVGGQMIKKLSVRYRTH